MAVQAAATNDANKEPDSIVGIGLRESKDLTGFTRSSIMGGAKMMLKTDGGLNEEAGANFIQYTLGDPKLTLMGPPSSRDDHFFSNPQEGKLGFTTPSIMDLFKADIDDFSGAGILPSAHSVDGEKMVLELSVINASNPDEALYCGGRDSYCELEYDRKYTPTIMDIVPNQVYKDHRVDWWINSQKIMEVLPKSGPLPMEELSFDGVLNNWEESIDGDTRMRSYRTDRLEAKSGDQKPGK
jgi:hypothetical protein